MTPLRDLTPDVIAPAEGAEAPHGAAGAPTAAGSVFLGDAVSAAPRTKRHADDQPRLATELIFPLHHQHNHAPGIVESANGDLLVSWYRGSGERQADDVAVYGARRRQGEKEWSEPFVMCDTPGFPDGNTAMFIDSLPVGVCFCDRNGFLSQYNDRAAELWGRTPAVGNPTQLYCGALNTCRPDGTPIPPDALPMAEALRRCNTVGAPWFHPGSLSTNREASLRR
jgi:hypothetical protein